MGKGKLKDTVSTFSGENYYGWKEQVTMYLVSEGLDHLLKERPPLPIQPTLLDISSLELDTSSSGDKGKEAASSSVAGESQESIMRLKERMRDMREKEREKQEKYKKKREKYEDWESENRQVVAGLFFCVHPKYRSVLKECESVKDVFTKFDEMFLKQDKMQRLKYKEMYQQFKFDS